MDHTLPLSNKEGNTSAVTAALIEVAMIRVTRDTKLAEGSDADAQDLVKCRGHGNACQTTSNLN